MITKFIKDNENILEINIVEIEATCVIAVSCKYIREKLKIKLSIQFPVMKIFLQLGDNNLYFANCKKKLF